MTTVPKPSSLANSLTLLYDAWNRVVQVTDSATIVAKYVYDGEGRRVLKHIDSDSPGSADGIDRYEHHYYVGAQLVETRNTDTLATAPESLTPKYQWVWSPRYIDAAILRDEDTDADGSCDDARLYFLNDANMNVTTLVDTGGDAVERYVYDPYGAVTIYNADWTATRSSSSYANATLYTGRHLDAESGLYFYRARYYIAELGRFLARDPSGYDAEDVNLYRYCADDPLDLTDPSGLGWSLSTITYKKNKKCKITQRTLYPDPPPGWSMKETIQQTNKAMDKWLKNPSTITVNFETPCPPGTHKGKAIVDTKKTVNVKTNFTVYLNFKKGLFGWTLDISGNQNPKTHNGCFKIYCESEKTIRDQAGPCCLDE